MAFAVSLDLIKAKLAERIDTLVPQLYPNAMRVGNEWTLGSLAGEEGNSLSIPRSGEFAGKWKDFATDEKGSVLDLVSEAMFGGDVRRAIPWAIDWLGLGHMSAEERWRQERKAADANAEAAKNAEADQEKRRRQAKALWLAGQPLPGTPAERYLLGRAIDLRQLGRYPRALVYHPECWCRELGERRPAMLAPINDGLTGEQIGVHRTYLRLLPDGRVIQDAKKHGGRLDDAKLSLGGWKGGHIPLWRGDSGKPLRQAPAGEWLTYAEGIENALSVAVAQPDMRVLAAVSLGNFGLIRLPPQIGGVFVAADNDVEPATQATFDRHMAMLAERGLPFQPVRAPAPHNDFNDWLRALAAEISQPEEMVSHGQ